MTTNNHYSKDEMARQAKQREMHPDLLSRDSQGLAGGKKISSHALAAHNARLTLKKAYPSTTFRVTSNAYSGGSSLDIKWMRWDGCPDHKDVLSILGKFESGQFNFMDDGYDYDSNPDNQAFRANFGSVRTLLVSPRIPTPEEIAARDAAEMAKILPQGLGERERKHRM